MTKRHPSIPPLHPGEVLREDIFPALQVSKTEIARSLGISRQMLYDILKEKKPVSAEMAVRLGQLLGNGPQIWVDLQRAYDLEKAEKKIDVSKIPVLIQHPTPWTNSLKY